MVAKNKRVFAVVDSYESHFPTFSIIQTFKTERGARAYLPVYAKRHSLILSKIRKNTYEVLNRSDVYIRIKWISVVQR